MNDIVLLDTSVYLNVLDVEGWNQNREEILSRFREKIQDGAHFILPMATIWETGNHIAHLSNGSLRRKYARILVDEVTKALKGETPYKPTTFPSREIFLEWLDDFPMHAMQSKRENKPNEGGSLSDLTIFKEWGILKDRHKASRVLIWSLDQDLSSYDTGKRD